MRILYFIITLPFLGVAFFLKKYNIDNIKDDLLIVLTYIEKMPENNIPPKLIAFLEAAEDHRYKTHYGIDFLGILRAIYIFYKKNEYQGASTIEQQLVRVITNRYERSKWRKFREQVLALLVDFYIRDKNKIAKSYIYLAFYGSGLDGLDNFLKRKKLKITTLIDTDMLELVSRLKYPEPLAFSEKWHTKILLRSKYTLRRYNKYLNKSLGKD